MSTLWETVRPIIARHAEVDLPAMLHLLGAELIADLDQLPAPRRADLVDRLVRNLRTLSVSDGPALQRELCRATQAAPLEHYGWELDSATALVALRGGLRYLATWLGYDWNELTHLQATICGLVRWVKAAGSGRLDARVEPKRVLFTLRARLPGVDARTLAASPLVVAVRDVTTGCAVREDGDDVLVDFCLDER